MIFVPNNCSSILRGLTLGIGSELQSVIRSEYNNSYSTSVFFNLVTEEIASAPYSFANYFKARVFN
jgi:hypothetical protein